MGRKSIPVLVESSDVVIQNVLVTASEKEGVPSGVAGTRVIPGRGDRGKPIIKHHVVLGKYMVGVKVEHKRDNGRATKAETKVTPHTTWCSKFKLRKERAALILRIKDKGGAAKYISLLRVTARNSRSEDQVYRARPLAMGMRLYSQTA